MFIKHKFSVTCIIFTIITLISAIPTIKDGNISNLHLVSRFLVTVVTIYSFYIYDWLVEKKIHFAILVHYSISMVLIFLLVYLSGQFIEPVTDGVYIDTFSNYTLLYLFVAVILEVRFRIKKGN